MNPRRREDSLGMVDHPLDFFVSYTGRDEGWAARRLELIEARARDREVSPWSG
jgi:hypothetical protein